MNICTINDMIIYLHAYKYHNINMYRNTDHFKKKQQNYKQAIEQEMQF